VATIGALIWICGFFTLPWVMQGCTGLRVSLTHFASDTCAGLGAADTLTRSPIAQLFAASSSDPLTSLPMGASIPMSDTLFSFTARALAGVGFIYLLLAALACWALLRLWSGPVGARRYGWSLAWLALACLVAAFAYAGSGVALANPVTLNLNITGAWTYGPGLVVALIGLAVAALGLSYALASALRLGQR
jgi:hypothetical protein